MPRALPLRSSCCTSRARRMARSLSPRRCGRRILRWYAAGSRLSNHHEPIEARTSAMAVTGRVRWIAGLDQAGSAFLAFLTSLLASRERIESLQPLCFLVCLWAMVPPTTPRGFDSRTISAHMWRRRSGV